jgi:hypothetical protein
MGKYDHAPYEVGKGKPPKATRFKKGTSGNPRGPRHRKKPEEATAAVLLSEILNEQIEISVGNRRLRIPKKLALMNQLVNDSLGGTPAQRIKAAKAIQDLGGFDMQVEDARTTPEMRDAVINQVLERLQLEADRDEDMNGMFKR